MTFHQAPEVDDNSMRSEESEIAARGWFKRSNGFIYRTEEPDYGVDVDVELIVNGKDASSWKFPIQLKSTSQLQIITTQQELFISLQFKVSRLGYLAKRLPAYGIILIYDDETKLGYFDYLDEIIKRLDEHSERAGWREQQHVNILIPLQIVDDNALVQIHRKMVERHERHEQLIAGHGPKFNIPYLQIRNEKPAEFDLSDPIQIVKFLKKYGIFLFNEQEHQKLLNLFQSLNHQVISTNSDLLFLAAITYTRLGNVIEADYYLRRIKFKMSELTEEQRGIIQFSEIRLEFLQGKTNYKSFLNRLDALKDTVEGIENRLLIRINSLYFELNNRAQNGQFEISDKAQIEELTMEISNSDLSDEQRHLLLVYQAENINAFALEAFLHFNSSYQLSLHLKIEIPVDLRVALARLSTDMMVQATTLARAAYQFAEQNGLFMLQASAAHNLGKFFFQTRYYLMMQRVEDQPGTQEEYIKGYRGSYTYSVIAYNHFMKLYMQQNAHQAVTNAYELHYMCAQIHKIGIGTKTTDELMSIIRKLEADNEFQPFTSSAEFIIKALAEKGTKNKGLGDLSDEEIYTLAKDALRVYDLPEDRLPNMIAEMEAIRLFDQRCKNPQIELLTNNSHLADKATKYAHPPSFILSHKQLHFQTPPSNDIESLLELHKHLLNQ